MLGVVERPQRLHARLEIKLALEARFVSAEIEGAKEALVEVELCVRRLALRKCPENDAILCSFYDDVITNLIIVV